LHFRSTSGASRLLDIPDLVISGQPHNEASFCCGTAVHGAYKTTAAQ